MDDDGLITIDSESYTALKESLGRGRSMLCAVCLGVEMMLQTQKEGIKGSEGLVKQLLNEEGSNS
jgi:hypothetical protein